MITLRPGIYEIGRDDGSIEPFVVKVGRANVMQSGTCETYDYYCEAIKGEPGWWFRWIEIPETCPVIDVRGEFQ